jgi:predicted transcriptional regulator
MKEKRSTLQIIASNCTKLQEGASEEKIREYLDLEVEVFSYYVEFALENNWIIKEDDGKYTITNYGKESVSAFRTLD